MPRFFLPLLAALCLGIASSAEACPKCAATVEQSSRKAATAYNASILLMAGMPFALTGLYGFTFYRLARRNVLAPPEETTCPPSSKS